MDINEVVRRGVRAFGYGISRIAAPSNNVVAQDPWDDMATFLNNGRSVFFDVAANVG